MTDNGVEHDSDGPTDNVDDDRLGSAELEDGSFIIYDRENYDGWIKIEGIDEIPEVTE